jgi:hypothetical protein
MSPGLEERLVWIFGSPRTGSTWLLRLLRSHRDVLTIDETYLPMHLVPTGGVTADGEYFETNRRADDPNYFFARRYLTELEPELRELVLRQLRRQAGELGEEGSARWVVIKEPNGTHAADSIFRLLPRGRMIFVLRDGRDVIDSLADAMLGRETWWAARRRDTAAAQAVGIGGREAFIRRHATQWVWRIEAAQRAFAALPEEQRVLIRYEDMVADTVATLRALYDWLHLEIGEEGLRRIVDSHDFSAIDSEKRGPGTKFRAATPGLWRENFDDDEKALLEEIMGQKLRELGYEN